MTTNGKDESTTQQQQAPPPPERSWSVMDFETDAALYGAMESCKRNEWILQNPDEETTHAQSLDEEVNRLRVLKSYLILDSDRESRFERITGLAARIFNVPIALVSLIDLGRQWFMSNRGLGDTRETPRSMAFCAHAIMSTQDMLVVNDATKDVRFMTNPLVTGEPHIRFYAGVPLVSPEGYKLGTLCIIDRRPRPGMSLLEKQNLRELAALVVETMVQRMADIERSRKNTSKIIACTAHDLLTPLSSVQLSLSLLMDDKNTWNSMTPYHKDLIQTSYSCSDVMRRICQHSISSFRSGDDAQKNGASRWKGRKKATGIKSRMMMDDDSEESEDDSSDSVSEEGSGILVISRLIESLRLVIDAYPKVVPISFEIDEDVPPAIISADLMIFRSAINYLTNACDNTRKGSIKLRVSTKKSVVTNNARTADVLLFECIDTGTGVDVKKYPTMLNAFKDAKLHNKRNINNASSGLGLCSVANNISSLGGDYGFRPRCSGRSAFGNLRISENEQMGSVFWFSIPLSLPTEKILHRYKSFDHNIVVKKEEPTPDAIVSSMPPVPPHEVSSVSSMSSAPKLEHKKNKRGLKSPNINDRGQKRKGSGVSFEFEDNLISKSETSERNNEISKPMERTKRALVIDDSLTIRKSIDRALTKEGFSVTQACNGMEGLEKMQHYLFDLCFCDFLMPVMDGLDCVQRYRQWEVKHRSWFQMYIIGISAHASQTDAERGLQVGMDKFFPKPLPLKTIKEICTSPEITGKSQILDNTFNTSRNGQVVFTTEFMDPNNIYEDSSVSSAGNSRTGSLPVCLIAMAHKSKEISICIERRGYGISWVHNGDEALKLLKMRNWDVVLLDDDLPKLTGLSCVSRFREWETVNRIARQNHMYIISENFISGTNVDNNIYPYGFDGALGKPVVMANLVQILESAAAVADTHDFLM